MENGKEDQRYRYTVGLGIGGKGITLGIYIESPFASSNNNFEADKHDCLQVGSTQNHTEYDDENLQNVTLFVTKRARFFLPFFSWGNPKRNPKRHPPLRTTSRTPSYVVSFPRLAERERNDPGLTNRGAGTSASRRALSASSVERTRPGRKRGRGYIGGINRIPIRRYLSPDRFGKSQELSWKALIADTCRARYQVDRGAESSGAASRMTRNRDARRDPDESSTLLQGRFAKQFLPRSVLLGGSSDPLRTRRAQDADAAF
ncbi:hypothetical protein DBV15_07183 [Temnothorax longispinosus]|uniref:Uncharacterized protein n=1 Tax=Temnothorax longispinosus TaxID=300112 RepID=A0A4S2JPP1_9HYME|nr:hypothetical protein DBV15_07183 [Temnothorax longispinosus]